jgi:DNA-binding MarR family transcriptional regulator
MPVPAEEVQQLLALYPRIFLACHTRHVRDRQSGRVISDHQASVLDHLDEVEPTGLLELAGHMGVTASTMSITVDRLVRGGYVVRERGAEDARRVCLRLTVLGARIKREKSVLDPDLVKALLRRLPPSQRREALHGLALLARAADEEMQSRSAAKARQ